MKRQSCIFEGKQNSATATPNHFELRTSDLGGLSPYQVHHEASHTHHRTSEPGRAGPLCCWQESRWVCCREGHTSCVEQAPPSCGGPEAVSQARGYHQLQRCSRSAGAGEAAFRTQAGSLHRCAVGITSRCKSSTRDSWLRSGACPLQRQRGNSSIGLEAAPSRCMQRTVMVCVLAWPA